MVAEWIDRLGNVVKSLVAVDWRAMYEGTVETLLTECLTECNGQQWRFEPLSAPPISLAISAGMQGAATCEVRVRMRMRVQCAATCKLQVRVGLG